jgi:hypothetical protein
VIARPACGGKKATQWNNYVDMFHVQVAGEGLLLDSIVSIFTETSVTATSILLVGEKKFSDSPLVMILLSFV